MGHKGNGTPVKFGFDDFQGLCVSGVTAHRFTDTHWQMRGGRCLLNLWPTTGKIMLASGETARVRTIDDVESFIGKSGYYTRREEEAPKQRPPGIAILEIEYWTAIRDGRIDDAGKCRVAIEALQT